MLCTVQKSYDVCFFGTPGGQVVRFYKSRVALQFACRRRFGAGHWRLKGSRLEVKAPYSGAWLLAGHVTVFKNYEWCD